MTGFIYAVSDGEGRVKIGWSADPVRRLTEINVYCPLQVTLLGVIEATKEHEAETHDLLAPWCVSGEWFRHEGPVAEFVSMLPKPQPKPIITSSASHPLRAYRDRHRLTLEALADRTGTTKATLSRIENGKQSPSRGMMARLRLESKGELSADDFLDFLADQEAAE